VAGHYGRAASGHTVDLRQLHSDGALRHPRRPAPPLVRRQKSAALIPAPTPTLPRQRERELLSPVLSTSGGQGTTELQLQGFPGIDRAQSATLGSDQPVEPPDTQIAVGPTTVVEMVNSNISTWSKAGVRQSLADLNAFYAVPAGYSLVEPRLLYDLQSGRFFATATAADSAFNSIVYIAVSQGSDPTAWTVWTVKGTSRVATDRPTVGTSDDKLTISWAEWAAPPCQSQTTDLCFAGQVIAVLQKSDLVSGIPPRLWMTGADHNRFAVVPAQALSSTSTQYLAYNNADPFFLVENGCGTPPSDAFFWNCPALGLISISGTPAANNIVQREADPHIDSTIAPADAPQQGSSQLIRTGDDRLVSAVWENGILSAAATDGNNCPDHNPDFSATFPGTCALIIQASTDSMTVVQDIDISAGGDALYYPAVSMDNAGDLFVVFSRSSATLPAGIWVTGRLASGTWTNILLLGSSTIAYDSTACGGDNRWGQYSSASPDGADPTDVWLAGMSPPRPTPATGGPGWSATHTRCRPCSL
jgi:hypothetical protein